MDLSQAPAFVAAKMAMLSDACAAAATRADELTGQISHVRDRLNGRVFGKAIIRPSYASNLTGCSRSRRHFKPGGRLRLASSTGVRLGWRLYRPRPCSSRSRLSSRTACPSQP